MKKVLFLLGILLTSVAYPFLIFFAKKRDKELNGAMRILVIPQLTRIGDIVCSTPVFFNIKKQFPNSHLAVLVSKKAIGIIKNNTRIDELIIIENYSWFSLIRKLQKEHFNWSVSLSATSVSTCFAVWSMIAKRIKTQVQTPPITERLTDWMSNYRLTYQNHTYLPHHHTRLLSFMGINNPIDVKEVFTSQESELKAKDFINKITTEKIVGISITAGNKIKELGDIKFIELSRLLLQNKKISLVFIGSKADSERIESLLHTLNNPFCFKGTDFNLEELPSLMKCFSLYIGVDTGPIYIAHALKIPVIDIIGPVDSREQPPQDEISIQIHPRGNIPPSSFVFTKRGSEIDTKKALSQTHIEDIYKSAITLLKM